MSPTPLSSGVDIAILNSDGSVGSSGPDAGGSGEQSGGAIDATGTGSGEPASMTAAITQVAVNPVGTSGDMAVLGNIARSALGVTGAGITVGIMSDSFNLKGGYATDVADGALPAGVQVLEEGPAGGSDEGRAMAELVHSVAPGAKIDFYSAFNSEADFAHGIEALAAAGANVIVDDVTYVDEPFFQVGGAIADAIAAVTAENVTYITSASNAGDNFYNNLFSAFGTTLPGLSGTWQAMNFGTAAQPAATQPITIVPGASVILDLQWDQPFASIGSGHASANSLGMVLYNDSGAIVASAMLNRTGGDPVQVLSFRNTTLSSGFHLAIVSNGGAAPPYLFKYIAYGSGITINDPNAGVGSGTVIGHALSNNSICVGAIAAANAPSLGGNGIPEAYSAWGPGTVLFDSAGNRIAAPDLGYKVDVMAPDVVPTSIFAPFSGTSAAAPLAAGVAALMLQAAPGLSPANMMLAMEQTAVPLQGNQAQWGAGLIQAPSAVARAMAFNGSSFPVTSGAFGVAVPDSTAPRWTAVGADSNGGGGGAQDAVGGLAGDATAMADLTAVASGVAPAPAMAADIAMSGGMFGGSAFIIPIIDDGGDGNWNVHIMA